MANDNVAAIANVAVTVLPEILALVRSRHAAADPGAPTPTDADVLRGLETAVKDSIAKDDEWLAAHPPTEG